MAENDEARRELWEQRAAVIAVLKHWKEHGCLPFPAGPRLPPWSVDRDLVEQVTGVRLESRGHTALKLIVAALYRYQVDKKENKNREKKLKAPNPTVWQFFWSGVLEWHERHYGVATLAAARQAEDPVLPVWLAFAAKELSWKAEDSDWKLAAGEGRRYVPGRDETARAWKDELERKLAIESRVKLEALTFSDYLTGSAIAARNEISEPLRNWLKSSRQDPEDAAVLSTVDPRASKENIPFAASRYSCVCCPRAAILLPDPPPDPDEERWVKRELAEVDGEWSLLALMFCKLVFSHLVSVSRQRHKNFEQSFSRVMEQAVLAISRVPEATLAPIAFNVHEALSRIQPYYVPSEAKNGTEVGEPRPRRFSPWYYVPSEADKGTEVDEQRPRCFSPWYLGEPDAVVASARRLLTAATDGERDPPDWNGLVDATAELARQVAGFFTDPLGAPRLGLMTPDFTYLNLRYEKLCKHFKGWPGEKNLSEDREDYERLRSAREKRPSIDNFLDVEVRDIVDLAARLRRLKDYVLWMSVAGLDLVSSITKAPDAKKD